MSIRPVSVVINECTCTRCGVVFVPKAKLELRRVGKRTVRVWTFPPPVCCGRCKSSYWNVERKSDVQGVQVGTVR